MQIDLTKTILLILIFTVNSNSCTIQKSGNAQYVDPFIGTQATHFVSEWRSEGSTYPGAVAPHGMVQPSPESSAPGDYLAGYYYNYDTIRRFSMAEHFSGWPNGSAGKGIFMPFSLPEEEKLDFSKVVSSFSHEKEKALPGYYEVFLEDVQINCAFAALTRSAIGHLSFQKQGRHGLLLGKFDSLSQSSKTELALQLKAGSGYLDIGKITLYLSLHFNQPFTLQQIGKNWRLDFESDEVFLKYGASYTSPENALLNLEEEIPAWDLESTAKTSRKLWDETLSRVDILKGKPSDKTRFYTALYHAQLLPVNATDLNGQYPGYEKTGSLESGETYYQYFTPWDSFRAKHPLYNLLYPEKSRDFMRSLVRFYQSNGRLPEPSVMTGVHLSSLVADALAKGVTDFDVATAYKGLADLIIYPPYFRQQMALYDSLGHVPYPQRYATTATLEFAFNDWALAQVARYLDNLPMVDLLEKRSLNYQQHFNPSTRFMETKKEDGTWAEASIYAEANAWNMTWFVPHDTEGLINLMGGDEAFSEHLDRNFREGHFVLDNECPMSFPFLFSHADRPWKTMEWKNKILEYYFTNSPGGIPGNDDWGSLSSWLAWSALGFYPVSPGVDELVISGPLFEKIKLNIPGRGEVLIESQKASEEHIFIQSATLNGEAYDHPFIKQSDLLKAEKISFQMGKTPNLEWGALGAKPFSLTKAKPEFTLLSLQTDKTEVSAHELFTLSAQVYNAGEIGSYPLVLMRDKIPLDTNFVLLDKGEKRQVDLPLRFYEKGIHTLAMGEKKIEIEVKDTRLPPQQALLFTAPRVVPLLRTVDSLSYQVEVQNISSYEVGYSPRLLLDGQPITTLAKITLSPGEQVSISGVLAPVNDLGFHDLKVESHAGTRFKVYEKPSETLVLHYTFNETSEQVKDHSGFDNHGQVVGSLKFVPGWRGKGIQTTGGYVQVSESPSMVIEEEELTMLCWYKPADEDGKASLITKGGHNMMKLNGKWQIKLAIGGWGVGQSVYNAPYDEATRQPAWLDQWSQFVGTRSDDVLHIFYNGELKSQQKVKGEIGSTPWSWRIGSNAEIPLGRTPDGVIDEVMIFAKALSEQEVQAIYLELKD